MVYTGKTKSFHDLETLNKDPVNVMFLKVHILNLHCDELNRKIVVVSR